MAIRTYLSIIILSVNRLNVAIKRHSVAEWITRPIYTLPTRTRFWSKDTHRQA